MYHPFPRVNSDMEKNAGVTCAGGKVSEADCYTVLIYNLNVSIDISGNSILGLV
jgi:hypothetical protein